VATIGYTTTEELARILQIATPSGAQQEALERVLTSSYVEILSEIDDPDQLQPLTPDETLLAAEVQLDRANEHWQQVEKPFGILGIQDGGAVYVARDSWDRHALKLAPLKRNWGFA
jgi:hypothetical protein